MLETENASLPTAATDKAAIYPSLRDRRVLITGGGSGIGESLVEAFARQGSRVAFVDIADGASRALVDRLGTSAWKPRFEHCDLTDVKTLRKVIGDLDA